MPYLSVKEVTKKYQEFNMSLSFEAEKGELVCILGPSGGGKSTLLSLLSGIENPDSGDITIDGNSITRLPIHQRGIGMVFQDFSLFPSMNTGENIEYGMRIKSRKERKEPLQCQGY